MSFVEVMIVMGLLAVIVSIMIPAITGVIPATQAGMAEANLERLNQAVLKFNSASQELTTAENAGDVADEQTVFSSLQARDAKVLGSPFLAPEYVVKPSSAETAYRASWNGRMFQMISPGNMGTGLDLLSMQP